MPLSSSATWRLRRLPSLFAALAMVAIVSACDSSTGNDDDIASITVTPPTPVLNVGSVQQLVANPTTSGGRIVSANVSWNSDAPGVATVDGNGLVTAVAGGTANISATAGGETASAVITVWHPVQTITLASAGGVTSIREEGSLQLTPTFTDATGAAVTGRQVVWTSSNPAVATVSPTGRLTGLLEGTTTITATALGSAVNGTFALTVAGAPLVATVTLAPTLGRFMAAGMTDQFVATARAASGTVLSLTGRTVVWSSATLTTATVSATGLVTMLVENGSTSAIRVSVDAVNSNIITVQGYPEVSHGVQVVTGTIPSGDSEFYVIDVPAASTNLAITLGGGNAGSDPDIYLYNQTGTLIGQSFNSGSAESITRANPTVGRYLVEVNAWDGAGDSIGALLNVTITPTPP